MSVSVDLRDGLNCDLQCRFVGTEDTGDTGKLG